MKNLLIVAYYFPPSGGPGVQRVLKHVRYLPEFGWNPHVLTVSNGQFPARDESLLEQVPDDVTVVRTRIPEPYDIYRLITGKKPGSAIDVNTIKKEGQSMSAKEKFAELIRATFFIPDARAGWRLTARKGARKILKQHKIDALYSSSPPYTTSLIARGIKRAHNLPWVAGFRDPWRGFISAPKRWWLPEIFDIRMERSVFQEADAVECAWQGIIKDALSK
ncbi:MAG: group 1 glycosyl transferase, partial [Candidatus Kapaibacterium sp.]